MTDSIPTMNLTTPVLSDGMVPRPKKDGEQREITGQSVADGIVMGTAVVLAPPSDSLMVGPVSADAKYTLVDFRRAVRLTRKQLYEFQQRVREGIEETISDIFASHLAIVDDTAFTGEIRNRIERGTAVQDAIKGVTNEFVTLFAHSTILRFREKSDDLNDIARRLLLNLAHQADVGMDTDYHGRILITPMLFPSDMLRIVAQRAEGIILTTGGVTAHISLLAQSLETPLVFANVQLMQGVTTGTPLLMDANHGTIYVNPGDDIIARYGSQLKTRGKALPPEGAIQPQTYTRDGRRIHLLGAIGLVSEASTARQLGAEGIGLYRSEMHFLIHSGVPSEDEQCTTYRKVMQEMEGREIVFRTLDIGGDKIPEYFLAAEESNPFLGLRGMRFAFRHQEIFKTQVRALLRAAHDRPIKIMFPLVSSVDSLRHARELVEAVIRDMKAANVPHQPQPSLGAMIELPCAVGMADALAAEADFLSIGSNDLVQHMLAVDRTNEHVADWYVPWHPAILRAIKAVVEAARHHNKPLSLCGDMAQDLSLIPVLIGIGITALTVPPRRILRMQRLIQQIDAAEAEELAHKVLATHTLAEIAGLLNIPHSFPGSYPQKK
jgi:phosphotransferase system enzyme I (PtsP)